MVETVRDSKYSILHAMLDQIAIVDKDGYITFINKSWIDFTLSNNGDVKLCGIGANYVAACKDKPIVAAGLTKVLTGSDAAFQWEYSCDSPDEKRWFLMQAAPIESDDRKIAGAIISHTNITQRKLLELRLRKLAITDTLTSLFNRRYFIKMLNQEISRSKRYLHPLSLMLIDIDDFKSINDTYGHETGDNAIRELSFLIMKCIRETDICARLGGDEFVVLLPETDEALLKIVSGRIASQVRKHKLLRSEGEPIRFTVSIGAISRNTMISAKEMLAIADKALYDAKHKGRDQISHGV